MSSYAPNMALGKPTESRRSNSPRRCYRGQPRRYLYYHGRPQDPRISPGQLRVKRARSPRRPNSRPAPEGAPQPNSPKKGIIVCIRLDPRRNSEVFDRRMSLKIINCLLESRLRQSLDSCQRGTPSCTPSAALGAPKGRDGSFEHQSTSAGNRVARDQEISAGQDHQGSCHIAS